MCLSNAAVQGGNSSELGLLYLSRKYPQMLHYGVSDIQTYDKGRECFCETPSPHPHPRTDSASGTYTLLYPPPPHTLSSDPSISKFVWRSQALPTKQSSIHVSLNPILLSQYNLYRVYLFARATKAKCPRLSGLKLPASWDKRDGLGVKSAAVFSTGLEFNSSYKHL